MAPPICIETGKKANILHPQNLLVKLLQRTAKLHQHLQNFTPSSAPLSLPSSDQCGGEIAIKINVATILDMCIYIRKFLSCLHFPLPKRRVGLRLEPKRSALNQNQGQGQGLTSSHLGRRPRETDCVSAKTENGFKWASSAHGYYDVHLFLSSSNWRYTLRAQYREAAIVKKQL